MVRLGLDRASSVSAWLNFAGNQNVLLNISLLLEVKNDFLGRLGRG